MLSVLSWNVAGRVRSIPAQVEALASRPVDVLALQEVRATTTEAWTTALAGLGYAHALTSLASGRPDADPARRLGVLIASSHPLQPLASPTLPWPERHISAMVSTAGGPVEVHDLHAPISSRGDAVKVRTLEALVAHLGDHSPHPVVVAGDFNTPQYESREGEVRSFARTRTGRLRGGFDERHDQAELAIVPGLGDHGFADVFRAVNGYEARDRSWMYANRKMGYRLDHIFARGLRPTAGGYVHQWREHGLSDHSAIWAELI
jgi:exonuclease III